jgi:imidazolonepropionase-like amidohydrolase
MKAPLASPEPRSRFKLTETSFKNLAAAGIKEGFGSGAYTVGHGMQAFQAGICVKWGMSPA